MRRKKHTKEKSAISAKDVCVKTTTSDRLESVLLTGLTVSTLLMGIAFSQGLAVDPSTPEFLHTKYGETYGRDLYIKGILANYFGGVFSAMSFVIYWTGYISLSNMEIHPEDYDSAKDWEDSFQIMLYVAKGLEFASMIGVFFGFGLLTQLLMSSEYSDPLTVFNLFGWLIGFGLIYFCYRAWIDARSKIHVRREVSPETQQVETVQSCIYSIDPQFAIYNDLFDTAKIELDQLSYLSSDNLQTMGIPLGHALRMLEKFRSIQITTVRNQSNNDADGNDVEMGNPNNISTSPMRISPIPPI